MKRSYVLNKWLGVSVYFSQLEINILVALREFKLQYTLIFDKLRSA